MSKSPQFSIAKTPLALACAATLLSGYVSAQESSIALEEVIVTASKRSESIQDVPMSITAMTGDSLERIGATTLLDFAVKVPNLGMAYEADGRFDSSSPSIRGVFGMGTTGFYIDDTQVTSSILPRVMDVERVEVLRGPQGSLYGARSMGGTIRMITKQPNLSEMEGAAHISGSSVEDGGENGVIDGSINIPVIEDVFAVRLSGYYGKNSGIYDRVYQESWVEAGSGDVRQTTSAPFSKNEDVDDEDYFGGQIAALWQITDNLSFTPKYLFQQVDADGMPFADIDPDNTTEMRFFDTEESGTDEWYIASGVFNWELEAGTIVSSTSWYERETDESEEEATFLHHLFNNVIGIPIDPLESPLSTVEKYETLAHETRFTSNFDGDWQLTAGVFYQDNELDHEYPRALQPGLHQALDDFTGMPGFGQDAFGLTDDDLIFVTKTLTDTKEFAVFGEITYAFNEDWSLTAGGRYYDTEVKATNTADGFANSGFSSFDNKQDESGFNPKVTVDWVVNDEVNTYATASKGFRVGGINGNLPLGLCGDELDQKNINPDEAQTFDSDELWSYELGFKSTLADNRVTLNGAIFFIDWTDVQQQNRLACGFQFVANAGEAESKGAELEISAAITSGLTGTLGVGYTDATITDTGDVPGVEKGDTILGVPDWTANGSLEYVFPISGSWEGLARADANYYGESTTAPSGEVRVRDDWTVLNLRAGVLNEAWEIILFADNVTDERANLSDNRSIAAAVPGRPRIITNRPRTIGLEARLRF
ncbi:MAG: outer membrane receptor protein involved in Fe transport [Alcanivorax sp.]|jgi:outer membrane receptor protein involved in Fe transport